MRVSSADEGMYLLPMLLGSRGRPSLAQIREDLEEVVAGFLSTFPCAVLGLGKGRGGLGSQPQQFPITAAENSKVPHPRSAEA